MPARKKPEITRAGANGPSAIRKRRAAFIIEIGIALLSNFRKNMLNGKRIAVVLPPITRKKLWKPPSGNSGDG